MAIYVCKSADGSLFSYCPNDTDPVAPASVLSANGLVAITGQPALDDTHAWNEATKSVITVAAPTPPNWIQTYQFILLFSSTEHAAISASTDSKVRQFMMALQASQMVNLNDPVVQGGISYLVSINLLTQANATLILSGQPSQ